jgi:hypothetical protein
VKTVNNQTKNLTRALCLFATTLMVAGPASAASRIELGVNDDAGLPDPNLGFHIQLPVQIGFRAGVGHGGDGGSGGNQTCSVLGCAEEFVNTTLAGALVLVSQEENATRQVLCDITGC